MEKQQKPGVNLPEVADRDDVHLLSSRCPFCHESVPASESVACQGCLARHHIACWDEAGKCASCASRQALRPEPRKITQVLVRQLLSEAGFSATEIDDYVQGGGPEEIQARCPRRKHGVLCNRPGSHAHTGEWLCSEHAAEELRTKAKQSFALFWVCFVLSLGFFGVAVFDDLGALIVAVPFGGVAAFTLAAAGNAHRQAKALRALPATNEQGWPGATKTSDEDPSVGV